MKGVYLVNCAGGMNGLHILNGHPPTSLFGWTIVLITNLLKYDAFNNFLFDKVRARETIRSILKNMYVNPDRVDDELVDSIFMPSEDQGANKVLQSSLVGDPGTGPVQLL